MNWWDALNKIAKKFPENDPYIQDFRAGMFGKSNMLFESIKSVETQPSELIVHGQPAHGSDLFGNIRLSEQSPDPLGIFLHEAVHASSRPGGIIGHRLKPDSWSITKRPNLELFTEILTGDLSNVILNRKENIPKGDVFKELAKYLLEATPLEMGTRAGRIVK